MRKLDQPPKYWDRLFAPSSCLAMISTADAQGRPNAGSYGTCTRVNHEPVYIAFTTSIGKDTANNILATGEFVANLPPWDKKILEKVRVVGLPFAPGVNELDKAGLTMLPSKLVKPPRIAECRAHFECRVEWTKQWLETRLTVVGRVVAASVNRDCVDAEGYVIHERLKPAHYCGHAYQGKDGSSKFVASYQVMEVPMVYQGPERERMRPVGAKPAKR